MVVNIIIFINKYKIKLLLCLLSLVGMWVGNQQAVSDGFSDDITQALPLGK